MLVSNTDRSMKITIHSHDGDSIDIMPGARDVIVDDKFSWNLPRSIKVNNGTLYSTNEPIKFISNVPSLGTDPSAPQPNLNKVENTNTVKEEAKKS